MAPGNVEKVTEQADGAWHVHGAPTWGQSERAEGELNVWLYGSQVLNDFGFVANLQSRLVCMWITMHVGIKRRGEMSLALGLEGPTGALLEK